jgi:hypothetical protein
MVRLTGISQDKSVNIVQSTENINMSGLVMQQDSGGGGTSAGDMSGMVHDRPISQI